MNDDRVSRDKALEPWLTRTPDSALSEMMNDVVSHAALIKSISAKILETPGLADLTLLTASGQDIPVVKLFDMLMAENEAVIKLANTWRAYVAEYRKGNIKP